MPVEKAVASIENYEARWLDALVPMWRASFQAGVGIVDPHPLAEQRAYFLEEILPHNVIKVAVIDGRLVGFIAATRESVTQLMVHVGHLRCGIGRQLLDWAKAQSIGSLWLFTFMRNTGARAFYERHGFVATAYGFEPVWQLEDVRYAWSAARLVDSPTCGPTSC